MKLGDFLGHLIVTSAEKEPLITSFDVPEVHDALCSGTGLHDSLLD